MTNATVDAQIVAAEKRTEASPAWHEFSEGPILTLPEKHPAPWSFQEELGYIVRDARGDIVIRCAEVSKHEKERLACAIAFLPNMAAEITRLRVRIAELESTTTKLDVELCAALKAAAPRARTIQQTERSDDAQIAVTAKQALSKTQRAADFAEAWPEDTAPIEAKISFLDLVRVLARPWGRLLDLKARAADLQIDSAPAITAPQAHPAPWDYKEEPDVERHMS
jgi:hypothetical protein